MCLRVIPFWITYSENQTLLLLDCSVIIVDYLRIKMILIGIELLNAGASLQKFPKRQKIVTLSANGKALVEM